ncbi:hypothetical protein V6Z11_D02G259300 [Gossypium hirsutum]
MKPFGFWPPILGGGSLGRFTEIWAPSKDEYAGGDSACVEDWSCGGRSLETLGFFICFGPL